ncbi:putative ribonuclease H-like domain-containing protein [Tanacetum coccineum]
MVAQGYTQEEGIEYDEVFAHVARIEAIRQFLAYASFKDFVVYQMDVKSAFIYGKIEEEVYVCQPLGFEDPDFPDRVYKVEKALYGLHQAPRAWYETLSTYLLDNGFQRRKINKTLFIKRHKGNILLVQVYVDDIIFGSTKKELCNPFKKLMHEKFQMSSMGELTFFIEVKTASTPMETQKPLLRDEDGKEVDVHMYRYQVNLKVSHLHAVKRIFSHTLIVICWKASLDNKSTTGGFVISLEVDYIMGLTICKKAKKSVRLMMKKLCEIKTDREKWPVKELTEVLQALVDGKKIIITESTMRRDLQLEDAEGVDSEMGEGSANPTNPHHTPTIIQPSTSQPQKKQRPRKPKRKDTQIPQSSGPTDNVADEAVNEEMDDSLERAATTAASLDAEQDKGGGPRRQETMGDTIAQTRFENVSKTSNDPLLARGNTLQSCEDCLKLNELMELCTNLQQRVLDLETTKTTQANEIASLKRRVKKLERRNKSRTHRLKRIYRVDGDEVIVENVDAAATTTKTDVEVTLAQELAELKCVKPMAVKVVIQEPEQGTTTTTPTTIISVPKPPQDKGKGIMIEEAVVLKLKLIIVGSKEQEELTDEEKARLFVQFLEQRRKHFAAKKAEEKRTDHQQESSQREYHLDEDKEAAELKSLVEVISDDEEEVEIDAVPLATKSSTIFDWKIHKEGKKSYYQIIRTDGKSQMYRVFSQMLKSFSTEDLEDLYKLTMFEPHVEDTVWRNQQNYSVLDWKLYDSCGVHSLRKQNVYIHMLVEKRHPLTPAIITDILNKKLQADHFSEMGYQLLKLLTKQLKNQ